MLLLSAFSALWLPLLATAHPAPACSTSTVTGFETVTGPVNIDTSPLTPFNTPKISPINQTAWEYWYFDAASSDGTSGMTVGFFRDPSLAFLGQGILRVDIDAVLPNGTLFSTIIFVNQSTVTTCPDQTTGLWNTSSAGIEISFTVSSNLQNAKIVVKSPQVSGTLTLDSVAPPLYPAGEHYPSSTASMALGPLIYWNEPIPGAIAHASFTWGGTPFHIDGFGSEVRNWGPFIWDYISKSWYWLHLNVGPYTLVYWSWVSGIDGKTYTTGWLSKCGVEVFSTRNGSPNEAGYPTMTLLYGNGVHGQIGDNSTGIVLDFVGEENGGNKWHFELNHTNVEFTVPVQVNTKYTRFVNTVKGGELDGEQWTGVGISEQDITSVVTPLP
jgi:hypothetical protein